KMPRLVALAPELPPTVVAPQELVTDRSGGRLVGYTMRHLSGSELLLRYAERSFRGAGITHEMVRHLFLGLHDTVAQVHRAGVVLGDFNDLNVLVQGLKAHVIDADSFQFGPFACTVFTARFVDPLLCDPSQDSLVLTRPHNAASDWYAFTVMLMQCLLFV